MNAKISSGPHEAEHLNPPAVGAFRLKDDGVIPNHPTLPLLIYERAINFVEEDPAAQIEHLVAQHKWGDSWRDSIYPYHHYHSTAHEVLAVASGSAKVQFGGEEGMHRMIRAGDVVVIPAGVAHKRLESSDDFEVVGAYPAGQKWDMCYGKPGERPEADHNIQRVPLPKSDPIYGEGGPLMEHWMG